MPEGSGATVGFECDEARGFRNPAPRSPGSGGSIPDQSPLCSIQLGALTERGWPTPNPSTCSVIGRLTRQTPTWESSCWASSTTRRAGWRWSNISRAPRCSARTASIIAFHWRRTRELLQSRPRAPGLGVRDGVERHTRLHDPAGRPRRAAPACLADHARDARAVPRPRPLALGLPAYATYYRGEIPRETSTRPMPQDGRSELLGG